MPKGPRGESRPADLIGCAVKVAKISVGEAEDDRYSTPGRRRSGQAGAKARADILSPERRAEIARKAANERWTDEGKHTMKSQCDVLADRFSALKGQGLVDVKFLLRNVDEATTEQVCREVGDMLDAFERGEAVSLDFKDSNRQ